MIESGETMLERREAALLEPTVKNCSVVPSPFGLGRKNLNTPSTTWLLHSAFAMSGVALSMRLRKMIGWYWRRPVASPLPASRAVSTALSQ